MLPPVGDGRRAGCWKRARRQRGKIEAQREKKAADVALVTDENDVTNESQQQLHKRLKVSEHWRSEHAASILEPCLRITNASFVTPTLTRTRGGLSVG